jgi:hypothetical protein
LRRRSAVNVPSVKYDLGEAELIAGHRIDLKGVIVVARRKDLDDGFTIVEVVVAAVVLAMTALVMAGLFVRTLGLAQSNTQRTTAANLATKQVEGLQAVDALSIPSGETVSTVTVGGTVYTLDQNVTLGTPTGTACGSTGGSINSQVISLVVTWPNMGTVQPVRTDTIRALGVGTDGFASTTGAAAVAVQNAGGVGTAGISVTLATAPGGTVIGTQNSGTDGCVVFAGLNPGNYTASVNTAGHVNQDGTQAATSSAFGVTASSVTKAVVPYDLLGALNITPTVSGGFTIPSAIGVTLTTSVWSPSQSRSYPTCVGSAVQGCVSGTTNRLAASLFPASYGAWAGTCADAATAAGTPTLVPVTSGATAAYTVSNFGRVNAVIGTVTAGKHLFAVHAADSTCTSGEVYDLGVVTTGQTVKVALPWGLWRMQLTSTGNVPAQSVTLSSAVGTAQTVAVAL